MAGVKDKLTELYDDGFKIVIITNQTEKRIQDGFVEKAHNIITELDLPIQIFASTKSHGFFRKPSVGLWYLLENNNQDVKIDRSKSFYVGDAAGRP